MGRDLATIRATFNEKPIMIMTSHLESEKQSSDERKAQFNQVRLFVGHAPGTFLARSSFIFSLWKSAPAVCRPLRRRTTQKRLPKKYRPMYPGLRTLDHLKSAALCAAKRPGMGIHFLSRRSASCWASVRGPPSSPETRICGNPRSRRRNWPKR